MENVKKVRASVARGDVGSLDPRWGSLWRVSFERARGRGDAIARRRAFAMDGKK